MRLWLRPVTDDRSPPRVAIFASVSSPQQAKVEKDSLPSQVRDGRLWAETVGGEVVSVYRVPGHSRKFIFYQDAGREMLAYRQLREDCEARRWDVLWCRARDRLGRTDALIAQVEALVHNAGAEVYSATMPTPLGESSEASALFLSAIERAQAQVENVIKTKRHRVGMRARVRRGLHPNNWPYGYAAVRDETGKCTGAEFVEEEAEVMRYITHRYLASIGYEMIARELNAARIPPRESGQWHPATVRKLLLSDIYVGIIEYGEIRSEMSDKFPALWDKDTYRAVLGERGRRRTGGRPPASPLTGMVVCQRCGYRMSSTFNNRRRYFRCASHSNPLLPDCHPNHVQEAVVIEAVEKALALLSTDKEIDAALAQVAPEAADLEREVERARRAMQTVEEKRTRLALVLAEGQMSAGVYRDADDDLVTELERAAQTLAGAQRRLVAVPDLGERRRALVALRDMMLAGQPSGWLKARPIATVRPLLLQVGIRVFCEDREILKVAVGGEYTGPG
jgi:DNA invertase Pin-like site-specific DNA recombinase